jgi:predicted DNA-binding protein YlxM (UPF0122 family)
VRQTDPGNQAESGEKLDSSGTFRWTKQRDRAALLLAEDDLSDAEIASQVGVSRATIHNWKQQQAFNERIGEHVAALNSGMQRYRIAKRRHRIRTLGDLHTRALTVIKGTAILAVPSVAARIRERGVPGAKLVPVWPQAGLVPRPPVGRRYSSNRITNGDGRGSMVAAMSSAVVSARPVASGGMSKTRTASSGRPG